MVRVVWTRRAISDIGAIHDYIAQFAPEAAVRMATRLQEAGDRLGETPMIGRSMTSGSRRELVNIRPYLIQYRLRGDCVEILTIRHGAGGDYDRQHHIDRRAPA